MYNALLDLIGIAMQLHVCACTFDEQFEVELETWCRCVVRILCLCP